VSVGWDFREPLKADWSDLDHWESLWKVGNHVSVGWDFREPLKADWSDLDHWESFGRDCNHKRGGCVILRALGAH
jgi:mannose-1-phosphate guanylyltransferase